MDVRWVAYAASGLLAAASLAPVTMRRTAEAEHATARAERSPSRRQPAPALLDFAAGTARLDRFLAAPTPPRAPVRNPFRLAEPAPAPLPPPAALSQPDSPPPPDSPSRPELMLVGMAERQRGDVRVRTAVVAGLGDVHLVVAGDRIGNRFTVLAVEEAAVDVRDDQTGESTRLILPPR